MDTNSSRPKLLIGSYFIRNLKLEGSGTLIRSVANGMINAGWCVRLLIPGGVSELHSGIEVHTYRPSSFALHRYIRALKTMSADVDAVLLIENNPNMGVISSFSRCPDHTFCLFYSPLQTIANLRNGNWGKQALIHTVAKHHLISRIQPWSNRRIIVASSFQKEQLTSCHAEKVHVLPGGGVSCKTAIPTREESRARLRWDDRLVVGYLGHCSTAKGVDILIDAVSCCEAPITLAVAFSGKGALSENSKKRLSELRKHDRLLQLGIVDPLAFFAACDVCAFPFRTSSIHHLPKAVLECFAAGTAVVSTCVGGIPEIVQPGRTGQLVRPYNTAELSLAIDTILSNLHFCHEMGRNARQLFSQELAEEVFCSRLSQILKATSSAEAK